MSTLCVSAIPCLPSQSSGSKALVIRSQLRTRQQRCASHIGRDATPEASETCEARS